MLKGIIIAIAVFLLVVSYSKYNSAPVRIKKIFIIYISALFILSTYLSVSIIRENFSNPKEWDFLCYFLEGNVAASGMNFYDPSTYKSVLTKLSLPITPSPSFYEEVVNVGCHYPPQTMFLFLPLSLFNFNNAYMFWIIINMLFLIVDLYLLWKIFLRTEGLLGLIFSSTLLLLLSSTREVIFYGQTSFILIFFLLLFWQDRKNYRSGIWIAFAILIKPILVFLFLYFILNKYWKQIIVTILTAVATSLASIFVFSKEVFLNYFTQNPNANSPFSVYITPMNQSILGIILRLKDIKDVKTIPIDNPYYLVISFLLILITLIIIYRSKDKTTGLSINILILVSLLIFPITLTHYSILLICPILFLVNYFNKKYLSIYLISAVISLLYFTIQLSMTFTANLFAFFIFAGIFLMREKLINKSIIII